MEYNIGQVISIAKVPCKKCFEFHEERVIELKSNG